MATWAGFSDEELRKIQKKGEPNYALPASFGRGRRSAPTNRGRLQLQREKALRSVTDQKENCGSPLSPDQQLNSSPPLEPVHTYSDNAVHEQDAKSLEREMTNPDPEPPVSVKELDQKEVELREKTRLEHLQWEQRLMEEKNKRRKALLAKTIAEKSKQTQAEAVKLKKIQKELQALDDSVSNDIGILRKLIEQASLEYSTAWKRLEKAEAEYVVAKLDLHKKTEAKERLTEHLCAIIQQNELRKACKLEELMLQLELSAEGEGSAESPTPQGAEREGCPESAAPQGTEGSAGGEREASSLPGVLNGCLTGTDAETPMDRTDISKDCATAAPKTCQDQLEEGSSATAQTMS